MSQSLFRVAYEKVCDLTDEENDVVQEDVGQLVDGPAGEMVIVLDFEDKCPDIVQLVEDFKSKVRPEVFQAIRRLQENGETFVIG